MQNEDTIQSTPLISRATNVDAETSGDLTRDNRSTLERLHIRTPQQLRARATELGGTQYIIDGLILSQSLSLVVGDSGLGKSPLIYQAAICVAAGIPFLGHEVRSGRVLYMDSENGVGQVPSLVEQLSSFLGLENPPEELLLWNFNDAPGFGLAGNHREDLVREVRPAWVIIDPINSVFNDIEQDATSATQHFQELRGLMSEYGCAFTGMHHVRKGPDNPKEKPAPLESTDLSSWFNRSRGSKVLINGSDARIGIDKATNPNIALAVRGFERLNGEIPPMLVARVLDEAGQPLGYKRASGSDLLKSQAQREAYAKLPEKFRFSDAKQILGKKGASSVKNFLSACEGVMLVKRVAGAYEKLPDQDGGRPRIPPIQMKPQTQTSLIFTPGEPGGSGEREGAAA
jgi:hypothetical protein